MNIYLDMDGVVVWSASPVRHRVRLIKYILKHYPDSTYWLTTHCKDGDEQDRNHYSWWLRRSDLPEKIVNRLVDTVKPPEKEWKYDKVEAVDFSQPFLWLDDRLLQVEEDELQKHGARARCYRMDKDDPKAAKKALKWLKSKTK